jgi:flagellar hook protein FlgE
MFSGVSGLFSQSSKMSAISDNIANANTTGYKRTDVPFSTMVTTQGLKHSYAAGGVQANPRMQVDRQGLLQATQSNTDLAINGSGFFVVNTSPEATTGAIANRTLFTRAGSFLPDANGNLRNTAGLYLQGWKLDSGGEFLNGEPARTSFDSLETVNVTGLNFTGAPTTEVTFAGNLPAGETGNAIPGNPIITGVEYFDPLGNPQTMNMQWTPGTDYGSWTLDLVPSGDTVPLASYQIDFHTSGPDSGTPASISEVWSQVGAKNLLVGTDNTDSFTGDVITIDITATTVTPPGVNDVTGTIGGAAFPAYSTVVGDDDPDTLAQNLAAHLDAAGIAGVASVTANSSGVITITATDDAAGAALIAGGATTVAGGGNVTEFVDDTTGDQPDTINGDVVQFDMQGGAANWVGGDDIEISLGGVTLPPMTIPGGGYADDAALATAVAAHIDANAAAIPGYTAGNAAVVGSVVTITGDDSTADPTLDGARLAANTVGALKVLRDTTANSIFVDEDGLPVTPSASSDPIIAQINANLPGGETQVLNFDLGEIGTLDGMTQFAGDYTPTLIERDGAQFGSLDRLEIDEDGVMTAIFNNGQTRPIYRIPVIEFVNPNGLLPVDGNAFQSTAQAGAYYMWDAGVGPAGEIVSASLENSTVDIAEEFSNMIIAQRAYSSNAKIIQTADEMLQEITNLKR